MMKAHGIHQPATSIRDTPIPSIRKEPKSSLAVGKKRKLDQFSDTMSSTADDDECLGKVKEEMATPIIKNEPLASDQNLASEFQYSGDLGSHALDMVDESSIFSDFLHSGAYEQNNFQAQGSYSGGIDQSLYDSFSPVTSGSGQGLHESIVITD